MELMPCKMLPALLLREISQVAKCPKANVRL